MPFDGKNFKPQTTDPFSLDALIAWLRTKEPSEEYCWGLVGRCLYAKYGAHVSGALESSTTYMLAVRGFTHQENPSKEPFEGLACGFSRTFGAALSRALALQAKLGEEG